MSFIQEYIDETINKLKDLDRDNDLVFIIDSNTISTLYDTKNKDTYHEICYAKLSDITLHLFIDRKGWNISMGNLFAYILTADHRDTVDLELHKHDASNTAQTYYDIVTGNIPFVIAQSANNPYGAPLYTQFYEKIDNTYRLISTIFNYIPAGWDTDSSKPLTRSKHLTIDKKLVYESAKSNKPYRPTTIAVLKNLNFPYPTSLDKNTNLSILEPQTNITEDVFFVIKSEH